MCLIAISRDFFESVLPKPELSREVDNFAVGLLRGLSSCFGGTSFLIFTTLSTIFVPITTGLSLSLPLVSALRTKRMELPLPTLPLDAALLLAGEQD